MNLHAITIPPAFDPRYQGTAEHRWELALSTTPDLILPDAEVLVVSPHPDDETLGAGGLIRTASARALEVSVLGVTDGEAAHTGWKDLRNIRRREVNRALTILSSYPLTRKRLGIPDGRVSQHRAKLFDAVDRLALPTTLLVAPYELDGHPDHDATGEVCIDIARRRGLILWRYPIWTWHHSEPERFTNHRWGRLWLDDETSRTKRLAIDCFTSQLRPLAREPVVPPHVVPYFARPYEAFLI